MSRRAFTLTEVLIGLALASLVLGIVLQSASRDVVAISHLAPRYQALLRASQILEYRMEDDPSASGSPSSRGLPSQEFPYDLSARPVVADPRVEQVEVAVMAESGRRETVSAYRLRVRRPKKAAPPPTASPSPEPAPTEPPASEPAPPEPSP